MLATLLRRLDSTKRTFRAQAALILRASLVGLAISSGGESAFTSAAVAADEDPSAMIPIRIDRCAVLSRSVLLDPFNGIRSEYVSGISIRFIDRRRVAATLLRIDVQYEGAAETIHERGTFAPDVAVERNYALFTGHTSGSDSAVCRLSFAAFVDGSTWTSGRSRSVRRGDSSQ